MSEILCGCSKASLYSHNRVDPLRVHSRASDPKPDNALTSQFLPGNALPRILIANADVKPRILYSKPRIYFSKSLPPPRDTSPGGSKAPSTNAPRLNTRGYKDDDYPYNQDTSLTSGDLNRPHRVNSLTTYSGNSTLYPSDQLPKLGKNTVYDRLPGDDRNEPHNARVLRDNRRMDDRSGKVGHFLRHGNVSLASFNAIGTKAKPKTDVSKALSRMLPYIVAATAVASLAHPPTFSWFSKKYYAPALGGIMLSIGIQLSVSDFILVFKRPLPVFIGYVAQYILKPVLAITIVSLLHVPPTYSLGFLLTASVAGAQLSSYAAYLADADVALSIVLTSLSTISSVALTPLITKLLIGSVIPIDFFAMAKSILQVVILPVLLGLTLNTYAKGAVDRVRPLMPVLAMVCTSLCIGSPLALNRSMMVSAQGLQLLIPVLVFHIAAFITGYWVSDLPFWRQDPKTARTISLCTGMQSSTLAMLLACQFLGPSQTVPPACSVVVMALLGLSIGAFWGKGLSFRECVRGAIWSDRAKKLS